MRDALGERPRSLFFVAPAIAIARLSATALKPFPRQLIKRGREMTAWSL